MTCIPIFVERSSFHEKFHRAQGNRIPVPYLPYECRGQVPHLVHSDCPPGSNSAVSLLVSPSLWNTLNAPACASQQIIDDIRGWPR